MTVKMEQEYYKQFMKQVKEKILGYLPEKFKSCKVEIVDIVKNNDELLNSLMIIDESSNMSPNIYLNDFFEELQLGKSMEEVLTSIAEQYLLFHMDEGFDTSKVLDYEQVKDKVICELRSPNALLKAPLRN